MGTASAKPGKMQAFVEAAATIRGELSGRITALRASYDAFQSTGSPVANPDLMDVELPGLLASYQLDETFVAVTRQAFLDANTGVDGASITVDERALDTAFAAAAVAMGFDPAQLTGPRSAVTVDEPVAAGTPQTSGFVADPVCTATGHFLEVEDDFTMPERLDVLRWRRTYSSRFVAAGPFGRGWASWASTAVVAHDDGTVGYQGPDGQMAVFVPSLAVDDPPGAYDVIPGIAARLVRLAPGNGHGAGGWELRWERHSPRPGAVWVFDHDGLPRSVEDPARGRVEFTHTGGLLTAVAHGGGRRLDIEWDGARIVEVRSSCGRRARYHYDGALDLVRTERVLGERTYVTDEAGRIVEVWDADGVRLCRNSYDDEGRVLAQVSPFGREVTFSYRPGNRTVVSDTAGGPVNVYEHDEAGRLVGLADGDGHVLRRVFDDSGRVVAANGFDGATSHQDFAADGSTATRTADGRAAESWTYDDHGRVAGHAVEGGPELRFDYPDDAGAVVPSRLSGPLGWEIAVEQRDGLVTALTDADGVTVRFEHDADGSVVATTNALGATTRSTLHASGLVERAVHPDGSEFACDRDPAGRLLSVRTPVGDEHRIEWSPAGRLTAVVEPDGSRTSFEHGGHGALQRLVDAVGATVELTHDHLERVVGLSAPGGAKWEFDHTSTGLLSMVHDPAGATWRYDYDAAGRMATATDPLGHEVRQRYDAAGRLAEIVDRSGNVTRHTRDALGRLVRTEGPEGATTTYEWDDWGRPVAIRLPDGETTTYGYSPAGRVIEVDTSESRGYTARYDEAGRLAAVTDSAGGTTAYEWDVCDRVVGVISPDGTSERLRYDGVGRLVETERRGRAWRATYDHAGRVTSVTGPAGATSTYRYDPRGKLVAATDPLGGTLRVRYDERGNPAAVVDPLGGVTTTGYDALRRPVVHTDQLGRVTRSIRDAAGRVVRLELPTGDVIAWRRDPRGTVTDASVNGRDVVVFDHDGNGRPVLVHEPGRNRTFTLEWTPGGRLRSLDVDGRTMRWERDRDGQVVARRDGAGRVVRYERDARGRVVAVAGDAWGRIAITRDPGGRLVAVDGPGLEIRWDRDAAGLVVGHRAAGDGGSGDASGTQARLERDAAGRVVAVHDGRGTSRYRYDDGGQLVAASTPDGAWTWRYDAAGRLEHEDGPDGARTFTYDAAHQLVEIAGPAGPTVFTYDAAGRRTAEDGPAGERRYTWDGLGRLTGTTIAGRSVPVDVDALGRLAAYGPTTFDWDASSPVAALTAVVDDAVVDVAGQVLGLASGGEVRWLAPDWQGSAPGERDAWGARRAPDTAGDAGAVDVGFLGEVELDGLVWLRHRAYDPVTRAFLSRDPLAGSPGQAVAANPYHYAGNDPVGFADPLGLQPLSLDQYEEYRAQETSVQWGNIAMVGLMAASFFIPGGPIVATLVGAGLGMAPGIIQGVTTGNWDATAIIKGAVVGGIAGRVGFAFGGTTSTMSGALLRGGAGGAASGSVGEVYDVLPLPGSDGTFDVENVALETVIGATTGGMGHRLQDPVGDMTPGDTQTVYRFYDPSDPNALLPRLASSDPAVQAAERLRLQDPDYAAWRADQHMQGYVDDSPFVSVIDDPMGAVNSTDPWLQTIATGSPGSPGAARAPSLGRFDVPSDRLIPPDPSNALSIQEGELLFQGDDLASYHVDTVPNPY